MTTELTRADLERLANAHLAPAMEKLLQLGVVVSVVAAPAIDPADGKAVVCSSGSPSEMIAMFEQAAERLRSKQFFIL